MGCTATIHTHTHTHSHTRRRSSVTSLPTIDVDENAYLCGRREVCLIPDRQARPLAAVCCMAPRCGMHALQFWLVPISHIQSTAQETCIVIDYENKNSRDVPVRIGPSQTLGLAAAASGKPGRSRHLLTTAQINEVVTFQGLVLVDPGPKRSGSSPTTVLVTSPAQALIPTDRRCRARPRLGRDGSQIDSALLACCRSDDWLALLDRARIALPWGKPTR